MRLPKNASEPRLHWSSRTMGWLWRLSAVAMLASGGVLAYASVNEMRYVLPRPPEVAQDVVARNVEDSQGKRASFRILLFSDEFRWRMSSHVALENRDSEPE